MEGSDAALDNMVEDSCLGPLGFAWSARVSPAALALTFSIACSGISTSLIPSKFKHSNNNDNDNNNKNNNNNN